MPDPQTPPAQVPPTAVVPPVVPPVTPPAEVPPVVPPAVPVVEPKPATPEVKPVEAKYELKLPENSPLNPKRVEEVVEFAKANKIDPAKAQEILDSESKAVVSYAESEKQKAETIKTGWREAVSKDPEIGGENQKVSVELAKRVVSRYFGVEFLKGLETTGFGDHPELIRGFYKLGKEMREDQLVMPGAKGSGEKPSLAETFYGAPKAP